MWVEDEYGAYVKTITVWGNNPRWLNSMSRWWRFGKADGELVRATTRATRPAGKYTLAWDGTDQAGRRVTQGTYRLFVEVAYEHAGHSLRSVDIDTINFDTGSWDVGSDQARRLAVIADSVKRVLQRSPNEVFLVEGHTDAVGADVDNLSLSDRRAQSVAEILTRDFQIPPENLTTQGYGEQYLKVNTQEASRENRRVTLRRITPLLTGQNQ